MSCNSSSLVSLLVSFFLPGSFPFFRDPFSNGNGYDSPDVVYAIGEDANTADLPGAEGGGYVPGAGVAVGLVGGREADNNHPVDAVDNAGVDDDLASWRRRQFDLILAFGFLEEEQGEDEAEEVEDEVEDKGEGEDLEVGVNEDVNVAGGSGGDVEDDEDDVIAPADPVARGPEHVMQRLVIESGELWDGRLFWRAYEDWLRAPRPSLIYPAGMVRSMSP